MGKTPSCVKAVRDVADFVSSLESDSYLHQIVDEALDVLKENMFAGQLIEKKKFPKSTSRNTGLRIFTSIIWAGLTASYTRLLQMNQG
jgi:hypothetical protein